jgi:beta-catenin-like protein 1
MLAQEVANGPEEEVLFYLRRLDGGLFTLQTLDYILAWIAMEDDGVRYLASWQDSLLTDSTS